jgi:hypothetical protein
LFSERGTKGFEKDEFLLRDLPFGKGAAPYRRGPSYWQIKPPDRIDLIWNDGFTGVTVEMQRIGYKLQGWAHPHFDGPTLVPRIAHAAARRVTCEAVDEGQKPS